LYAVALDADSFRQSRRYSDASPAAPPRTARSQAPVAQRIEQQPSNLSVVGSSPTGGAKHRLLGKGLTPLSTYAPIAAVIRSRP
jgi:hypothetical protein